MAAPPSPDSPAAADRLLVLRGVGGCLTLGRDRLMIERHGLVFSLLNLGFHVEREIGSVIWLDSLAGVHLVRSFLLVQFLRFTYPGCPAPTGDALRDAFAENAFMLSFWDNRPLLDAMRRIEAAKAAWHRCASALRPIETV